MNLKRKFLQIFGILILFISSAYFAYADVAAVSVYPVTESIILSRNESHDVVYTVCNNSNEIQHVNIEPRYWHISRENRSIPLESWLKVDPAEFDIGPKEEREIVFNVSVPKEAVGELAAMIAFKPRPKEGQTVNVVFSVSLYVRIKDTENINCKISKCKLWKFEDRNALGIAVTLKNLGNVHLKPKITVFIQDIFNKNLEKAVLGYGKPTYPGKTQDYQGAIYNFKLNPGFYKAMIDTEYTYVAERFRRKVYFLVGREGKVLFIL